MQSLPPNHFLSLPRPNPLEHLGFVDTTTLAAHDFDVDNRTGFMPPHPPVKQLPTGWAAWENILDEAIRKKLQLGDTPALSVVEKDKSAQWRDSVRVMPPLSEITALTRDELLLRRAHLVLAWIMHFYIHTLPPSSPVIIPASLTIPLLRVSTELQLPPVLTYSDTVLYNWSPFDQSLENLRCNTLFTSTPSEEEFYLTSARMELRGVEALDLMRSTMDELFIGDAIAIRRVTTYLTKLALVIKDLKRLLLQVKEGCDPEIFWRDVRPWFRGVDSSSSEWVFEGIETDPTLTYPQELSGPSAGQSSLIHALDIFLGVDQYSHASQITGGGAKQAFLERMQMYMPRHHRNFLRHLSANPRPLRPLVEEQGEGAFVQAYNEAVKSLKELRDAHLVVVALYIVGPAARASKAHDDQSLVGTGGTQLMKFLKDVRDGTRGAIISG